MIQHLLNPVVFAQATTIIFLAVLFLQSGLDKVFNFADNLAWLKEHFAKSPVRGQVKGMLLMVTVAEVSAGILALVGGVQIVLSDQTTWALYGAQLATIDILMLFIGQRLAKDYAGAATLVPYFMLCVGEVLLLNL